MNGLLDPARLTPEDARPVDLARAVEEVLTLARYQVAAGVTLQADIPDDLFCHLPENRLRQALLNLVLNAAQMMTGGGLVTVRVRREGGPSGEQLVIEVSDQGPGFAEVLLRGGPRPHVSARPGGTGLGLASVRRLALDLGGSLTLENLQPRGARVSLRLPCARPEGN
jgi:signal transduction histidine kinase